MDQLKLDKLDQLKMDLYVEDRESGLKVKERVRKATEKKEQALKQPTWVEVWETGYTTHTGSRKAGILQTKLTDNDKKKVLEVKHAIEGGEIGTHVEGLKKFTKSHALNLYKVLMEQRKEQIIAEMIEHCPENYHLITTVEQMEELLELLAEEDIIGLDTETTGLDYFGVDYIVGISMSLPKADYHCYIPFRHIVDDMQLAPDYVLSNLKEFLEDENLGKVLHNAKFDYHMFTREGIFLRGIAMDTKIAMHILNENEMSYALKNIATKYGKFFGFEDKSNTYEELFGKGGFERTPLQIAKVYACKDTHLCLALREWILTHMHKQPNLYDVYHNEENEVLKVSIAMEQNGFEIDLDFAESYKKELEDHLEELDKQLKHYFGDINVGSNQQLSEKIYKEWKIDNNGNTSVDADTLKYIYVNYKDTNPNVEGIKVLLEYREFSKLLSTYIEPMPRKLGNDGRLHGKFNQDGTKTGRYSSNEPNLQNLPVRARQLIIAPEGKLLMGIDFS